MYDIILFNDFYLVCNSIDVRMLFKNLLNYIYSVPTDKKKFRCRDNEPILHLVSVWNLKTREVIKISNYNN